MHDDDIDEKCPSSANLFGYDVKQMARPHDYQTRNDAKNRQPLGSLIRGGVQRRNTTNPSN